MSIGDGLTWGTVFAAYPDLQITHRARTSTLPSSDSDGIIPFQDGPVKDKSAHAVLSPEQDSITVLYSEIAPDFEAKTLQLVVKFEDENTQVLPSVLETNVSYQPEEAAVKRVNIKYPASKTYSLQAALAPEEIK